MGKLYKIDSEQLTVTAQHGRWKALMICAASDVRPPANGNPFTPLGGGGSSCIPLI